MALLCAQDVKLHVHNINHAHNYDQQHGRISVEATAEHSHLSEAHLSSDSSHDVHHDEVVSELDVRSYGLLKKVSNSVLTLALFVTALALLLPALYQQTLYRRRDKDTVLPWQYHLSPPLRAPPR